RSPVGGFAVRSSVVDFCGVWIRKALGWKIAREVTQARDQTAAADGRLLAGCVRSIIYVPQRDIILIVIHRPRRVLVAHSTAYVIKTARYPGLHVCVEGIKVCSRHGNLLLDVVAGVICRWTYRNRIEGIMALRRAVVFVAPGLCEQVGTGDEAVRIRRRIIVPTLSLVEGRACVLQI